MREIVLGIATTVVPKDRAGALRPADHFCNMAKHAHGHEVSILVFSPHDVNWTAKRVTGWKPINKSQPFGSWKKVTTALPDVIYENVYVHLAVQGYTAELRMNARLHGIPLFNPVLPGKWRMAEWMKGTSCEKYQPATHLYRTPEQALVYLKQWQIMYFKPVGGYGGTGVTRIERQPTGQYRISVDRTKLETRPVRRILTEAELKKWLAKHHGNFLLQQGLDLLTVGGRKVDFRVVAHRTDLGTWKIIGVVPKLAMKDGVVTNIIAGGERLSLEVLQTKLSAEGKELPIEELKKAALQIAELISRRASYTGLVGFDMGIDNDQHVWMIEMNPKPARSLLSKAMREKTASEAVGFARFLARQRKG